MNNDRLNNCYWCGENATTKEHVPPLNLFPENTRKNLITVGACEEHNNKFSKIDERLRIHMVALGSEEIARPIYENKVIPGLNRKQSRGLAINLLENRFNNEGKQWQKDSVENFDIYFEKIIRGLFFHHYGICLVGSTSNFSNKIEHLSMTANAHFYYHLLEEEYKDKWIEGNPQNKDIFDYKYYYCEKEKRFFTVMRFYKEHRVYGVTLPLGKNINDYGLEFEDYKQRIKKLG